MGKTDKDQPAVRKARWWTRQPTSWNKQTRRHHRARARQAIRNGQEPPPKFRSDREWYW